MGQGIQRMDQVKICGRQPLKKIIWSILEYLDSHDPRCCYFKSNSKATGLDNLSRRFLKHEAKFLSKYCN